MRYTIIILFFIIIGLPGCLHNKNSICFKDYLNHHTFRYCSEKFVGDTFNIEDTLYTEFINGKEYKKSKIGWTDCDNYYLVVRQAKSTDVLKNGDTLFVNLISLNKDTITYEASAFGVTLKTKMRRIN